MIIIKLKYICHYIIYPQNIASYVLKLCLSTITEISENVVCMSCAVMILVHVVYIGCHGHRIHWRNQPGWLFGDEYVEMYDIFRRPFCSICDWFGSVSLCIVYGDSRVPENWHRWIFMDSDQIIASSPCQSLWLPLHVNPLDGHAHLPCTSSCCPNNINYYTVQFSFIWWKGIPDSTWYYIRRHNFGPHCYIMQWYWYYDGSDSTWYCIWDPR